MTQPPAVKPAPLPPVAPAPGAETPITPPTHPLASDEPNFLRLGNMPEGKTPVRVGVLLPFTNGSAGTRVLSANMMKAAELALFDARSQDIVLISADEGSTPQEAAAGARSLLAQGAEVIIGPLFSQSVTAVAPLTRDRAVPLISFSTDRSVAGDGVYLLSFQPENELRRIVTYAAAHGHTDFAALVPDTIYGERVEKALTDDVKDAGAKLGDVEKFTPTSEGIAEPVHTVAATNPDAILIAQGGPLLREIRTRSGRRRRTERPGEISRHRIVGRSFDREGADAGGRLVCRARARFRTRLRCEIPHHFRTEPAATGHARL